MCSDDACKSMIYRNSQLKFWIHLSKKFLQSHYSSKVPSVSSYFVCIRVQNNFRQAERKKVERRNVGYWVNKVWYDDEKITKETIQKSFKRCGIKAPALRA